MTTVVAIARDGQVHMAADSVTNVYERPIHGAQKILRKTLWDGDTEALLGFAGDGALPHLAAGTALAADRRLRTDDEVAHRVAEALSEIAKRHDLLEGGRMDASVLFGYHGRVWTLVHQQAIAHTDGLAAIGSGEGPAIGALWILSHYPTEVGLADIVQAACRSGIRFDRYSGGDVQVESIGQEKTP